MSEEIDSENPESHHDPAQPFYTDYTKPLPMYGHPYNPKIPDWHFYNRDLEYLIHVNTQEKKYATSLTKYPSIVYTQFGIKENIEHIFSSQIDEYHDDSELRIHH